MIAISVVIPSHCVMSIISSHCVIRRLGLPNSSTQAIVNGVVSIMAHVIYWMYRRHQYRLDLQARRVEKMENNNNDNGSGSITVGKNSSGYSAAVVPAAAPSAVRRSSLASRVGDAHDSRLSCGEAHHSHLSRARPGHIE